MNGIHDLLFFRDNWKWRPEIDIAGSIKCNGFLVVSFNERDTKGATQSIAASAYSIAGFMFEIIGVGKHLRRPLYTAFLADADSAVAAVASPAKDGEASVANEAVWNVVEGYHFWRRISDGRFSCLVLRREGERLQVLVCKGWILRNASLVRIDGGDP
jgi:hypothetical protein